MQALSIVWSSQQERFGRSWYQYGNFEEGNLQATVLARPSRPGLHPLMFFYSQPSQVWWLDVRSLHTIFVRPSWMETRYNFFTCNWLFFFWPPFLAEKKVLRYIEEDDLLFVGYPKLHNLKIWYFYWKRLSVEWIVIASRFRNCKTGECTQRIVFPVAKYEISSSATERHHS